MKRAVYTVLVASALAGCAIPQLRVFQAKIDPKLAEKPAEQVEAERRGAAYIAVRTGPLMLELMDFAKALGEAKRSEEELRKIMVRAEVFAGTVRDIHEVAVNLSSSLGQPVKSVTVDDKAAVIASLREGLLEKDAQIERWRSFVKKYAGKPIEDTGINLAGPAGFMALLGVVAACIFIPGFGWVLMRLLPVLWAGLRRAAGAVESLAAEAPEAVAKIKAALPQREDAVRRVLRKAKPAPSS